MDTTGLVPSPIWNHIGVVTTITAHNNLKSCSSTQKCKATPVSYFMKTVPNLKKPTLVTNELAKQLKLLLLPLCRQAYIRKLMEKIRFPLMPPRDLMVHVNVVDFMRTKCNDLLLEVSRKHPRKYNETVSICLVK